MFVLTTMNRVFRSAMNSNAFRGRAVEHFGAKKLSTHVRASPLACPSPAMARLDERSRPPSHHRLLQPHSRTIASKKGKKGGEKKGEKFEREKKGGKVEGEKKGGKVEGGKKGGTIDVCPVFSRYDVADYDGLIGHNLETIDRSLKKVQGEMEECGMSRENLEYYDPREKVFRPLTSKIVENWQGGVMKVRDPEQYLVEDEGDVDGDYGNYDPDAGPRAPAPELRATVVALAGACRAAGFERAAPGKLRDAGGKVVDTERWVTALAAEQPYLLRLIVDRIGALDHLVRCIHLDPVWEGKLQEADSRKESHFL